MEQIAFAHQVQAGISGNPIFSKLPPEARQRLARASALFRIIKHETLYLSGDDADHGWAVVSGQIKIVSETHSGHRLLIEIITAGELCGGRCYSDEGKFTFSAVAMEETTALHFPIADLERLAEQNPNLMRALAQDTCRRLHQAQHMRSLSVENVIGRVACALVYLQDKFGDTIPHSRATLAELAGTTVESAIRATRVLGQRGILETQRNRIEIASLQALKDFAHKPAGRKKSAR